MQRRLVLFIVFSVLYVTVTLPAIFSSNPRTIKAGIYENEPKIFADEGIPSGFWVDLLGTIASREDWNIVWVHGTWDECIQRLAEGKIDVMPDVAYTEERSKEYVFQDETVFISWARVYVPLGSNIQSFPDLGNKRIAVLNGSVNYKSKDGIKELTEKFGIDCIFVETDNYSDVFKLLEKKEVDAGVVNKNFGNLNEKEYKVKRTPIVFQPADLRFAFPKKSSLTPLLIARIDHRIKEMKANKDSAYYNLLEKYFEGPITKRFVVYPWIKKAMFLVGGIFLFLLLVSITSGIQVRRKTKQLEESEERYRKLFDSSKDAIMTLDPSTFKFTSGNPSILDMFKVENEKVFISFTPWVVSPEKQPDGRSSVEKAKEMIRTAMEEGSNFFEWVHQRCNGDIFPATVLLTRVDFSGKPSILQATVRDVTKFKQAGRALRESEERYRALFENSAEGILVADIANKQFLYANSAICRMLGYSKEELTRMSVSDIHPKNSLDNVFSDFEAQSRGEKTLASLTPCLRKDGTIIYSDIVTTVVEIQGRKCNVGFFTDKTDYKKAEEEKEKINLQLFQAQKMESVGRLAGTIAHDFNNLLTVIIGYGSLLRDEIPEDDSKREMLEEILYAANQAARLTGQLLAFSRKGPTKLEVMNLNSVVNEVKDMIDRLVGEDIVSSGDIAEDSMNIKGDITQIKQVVLNLIVNARDAMPEGGELYIKTEKVTIGDSEISGIPYSYAGEFVCLTVSDTGIGMSEEELSKIFAPFYTTKENGTGLGLSVVQEIIKKHEGWINVESEPGKGAAFKIYIPLSYEEEELKNKSDIPLSELRGAGETILIVEDEEITRTFLSRVLKENGYSIFEADSIEEAKRIFEKNEEEIKMVFSDVILADGSGLAFVEELFSENQNIRILLSSGYISDKVEILNVAKEKFDFLEKPYDVAQLLRKVKEILA